MLKFSFSFLFSFYLIFYKKKKIQTLTKKKNNLKNDKSRKKKKRQGQSAGKFTCIIFFRVEKILKLFLPYPEVHVLLTK